MTEHVVCGIDGCTLSAHPKILDLHVKMQHMTGLFKRMANKDSPMEVDSWIADRKKNFPTAEKIAKKQEEKKERVERGEVLEQSDKKKMRPNWKNNGPRKFKKSKRKFTPRDQHGIPNDEETEIMIVDGPPPEELKPIPDDCSSDPSVSEEDVQKFSDDEWSHEGSRQHTENSATVCNVLSALRDAYDSDSSDEKPEDISSKPASGELENALEVEKTNEEVLSSVANDSTPQNDPNEEDDEAPCELTIEKEEIDNAPNVHIRESNEANQVTIKNIQNRKTRKLGSRPVKSQNMKKTKLPVTKTRPRPSTLLQRLLASEIQQERNMILQCIRYIINNNYFEDKTCKNDIGSNEECAAST